MCDIYMFQRQDIIQQQNVEMAVMVRYYDIAFQLIEIIPAVDIYTEYQFYDRSEYQNMDQSF